MALRLRTNTTTNIQRNQENILQKKGLETKQSQFQQQKRTVLGNRTNAPAVNAAKPKSSLKDSTTAAAAGTKIPVLTAKKQISTASLARPTIRKHKVDISKPDVSKAVANLCTKHVTESGAACRVCAEVSRFDTVQAGRQHLSEEVTSDRSNAQLCAQYTDDLHKYMRLLEVQFPIRARYLDVNGGSSSGSGCDIKPRMRQILVHWMCQVAARFELMSETTYLAIAILDRYLQDNAVSRKQLQLVGGTSLLLASKYEELMCPEVNDFVYISDSAYTHQDVIGMEMKILKALNYSFGRPVPLNFLRRLTKVAQYTQPEHHVMGKYLMELTVVDYDMVHYRPSQVAAAATHLAQRICTHHTSKWTDLFAYHSGYNEDEIMPCMKRMAYLALTAPEHKYLKLMYDKYSSQKNQSISLHHNLSSGSDMLRSLAGEHLNPHITPTVPVHASTSTGTGGKGTASAATSKGTGTGTTSRSGSGTGTTTSSRRVPLKTLRAT